MASRSMPFFPVALSLLASLLNGIFILGGPADAHYYGMVGGWIVIGWLLVGPVSAHVIVPTFYNMKLTSAYEYLERRFNYATRVVGSVIFALSLMLFLSVVLYAPAIAFEQVTTLSLPVSIVITGLICTVYTGLGGMKAVIWTDTIQVCILFIGLIMLSVIGSVEEGGFSEVWKITVDDGRSTWINFSADPRERHTFWTQVIGQWVIFTGINFSNQMMIQRYMTVRSLREAQIAMYLVMVLASIILVIISILGLVIHARYRYCDPVVSGAISDGDKIVPYFLLDIIGHLHGLPGLFTASVFAAALSSVSSAVNSLAAVVLEDFIKPGFMWKTGRSLTDKEATYTSTGLAFGFGILTIVLSFIAEFMSDKLIESTGTIWSIVGGPLAGAFIMGFFFPWVNSWGAISGMVTSLVLGLWLGLGSIIHSPPFPTLPIGICMGNITISSPKPESKGGVYDFYDISYAWYGVFSIGICVTVGNIVSLLTTRHTGKNLSGKTQKNPSLYFPFADSCCCCLPDKAKDVCYCGVPYRHEEEPTEGSFVKKTENIGMDNPAFDSQAKEEQLNDWTSTL